MLLATFMPRPAPAVFRAAARGLPSKSLWHRSRNSLERESIRSELAGKFSPPPLRPTARGSLSSSEKEFPARVPVREAARPPLPSAFLLPAQTPRAHSADAAESCQSHQFSFASPRSSCLSSRLLESCRL